MKLYCVKKINGQYSASEFNDTFFEYKNIRLSDYYFSAIKLLILRKVSLNPDLKVKGEKLINSITQMLDDLYRCEYLKTNDFASNKELCIEIANFLNSGNDLYE